jgi:predicted transcriptional regulator of viral defense system
LVEQKQNRDRASPVSDKIIEVLENSEGPMSITEVYEAVRDLSDSKESVRALLSRLALDGEIKRVGWGKYEK